MRSLLMKIMLFWLYRATPSATVTANTSTASGSTSMMERLTPVSQAPHLHEEASASATANAQEVAEIEHFAEQLVGHMAKDHESSQNATNHSDHNTFHPISEGLQVRNYSDSNIKEAFFKKSKSGRLQCAIFTKIRFWPNRQNCKFHF